MQRRVSRHDGAWRFSRLTILGGVTTQRSAEMLRGQNVALRNTIRGEPVLANGPKLTGLAPHALKFSTRDPPGCGDKSGAARSYAAVSTDVTSATVHVSLALGSRRATRMRTRRTQTANMVPMAAPG